MPSTPANAMRISSPPNPARSTSRLSIVGMKPARDIVPLPNPQFPRRPLRHRPRTRRHQYLEGMADAVKVRVLAGIPCEIRLERQSPEELDIEMIINNDTRQPARRVGVIARAVQCFDEPPNGFLWPNPREEALEIAVVRVCLSGIAQT